MSTSIYGHVIPENDQTAARRENLEKIARLVGNLYPNGFRRTNVAGGPGGEDTVSALARAFRRHEPLTAGGSRPTAEQLEAANAELNGVVVRVAGRLATPPRVMGKAAFVHLSDGAERLQIYVRRQEAAAVSNDSGREVEEEESGWKLFQLLDHGDFVGVEGFLFVTKTGELSVHVRALQFLSKALLPMPDKMHGIADPEIRQRQRYVDLIASGLKVEAGEAQADTQTDAPQTSAPELSTREVFERRSKLVTALRRHLDDHGYVEVETPMLSPIASGAAARPFETHHNALDIKLYLRIAPELYLKRLLVGGFERVYELNRNFRNEGISTRHNPEFTMLEFYCAYMDASGMMDFCEEMLRNAVQEVTGGTNVCFGDAEFDFGRSFERLTMREAVARHWPERHRRIGGRAFEAAWLEDPALVCRLARFLEAVGTTYTTETADETPAADERSRAYGDSITEIAWSQAGADTQPEADESEAARALVALFESVAEEKIVRPTFIHDFPKVVSPLSKASPGNPAVAERFELYVAGMEVANGFSELNDPQEQLERFEEQGRQRERGDDEAMQTDEDYVRALAYGMPPAAGIGIGVDRLAMLLTNRRSIRDVILFPHMRPRRSQQGAARPDGPPTDAADDDAREHPSGS
ncbi:MAG TPA: lysine--tRNA ligase [Pyrinomonadaceae bacterium]|nr:lysine--tRNA ligase [Pyrinomonadaceae bacterium]